MNDNVEKLYISLGKKQSEIEEQMGINKRLTGELQEKDKTINELNEV